MKVMKETPINDMFAKNGRIREDGRMVHDMYLFEVKKPSESKKPWDYYKQLAVVPGDKAFFTAKESGASECDDKSALDHDANRRNRIMISSL